jgi:hypothetical protein
MCPSASLALALHSTFDRGASDGWQLDIAAADASAEQHLSSVGKIPLSRQPAVGH